MKVLYQWDSGDIQLKSWKDYYNNLEHWGLNGKSPNEFLQNYQLTNPPIVCA